MTSSDEPTVAEVLNQLMDSELLSRTVVLADGVTGADALAAGWWTSFWQVPVFLHDGSELLPDATVEGLQTMDVSNIIVLGGESRIPRSAVVDAVQVTGAATVRIEGTDRYATSVAMARHFGGWWPTDRAFDASGSLFCVAASSGEGGRAVGWSDALGAGPLCGAMTADERGAPVRLMGAVNSSVPIESSEVDNRSRSAVPIILLPPGNADWPKPVSDFFEDMFPPGDAWCDGEPTGGGCAEPAFAVGFGGPATLSQQSMERVSRVSGGHRNHVVPESTGEPPFLTSLSMAPSFHQNDRNVMKICHLRGSYQGARWLTAGVNGTERPKSFEDVSDTGWYLMDERGYSQNNRNGTPGCVGLELIAGENAVWARNLGPQGQIVQSWVSDVGPASRVVLDGLLTARSARTMSGVDSAATGPELSLTTLTFGSPTPGVQIDVKGRKMAVTAWDLILNLRRGSPTRTEPPHTFEATMLVQGDGFGLSGDATGEAVYSAGTWFLRGRAEFQLEADSIRLSGGFSLDLFVGDPMILDDRVSWRFDGFG